MNKMGHCLFLLTLVLDLKSSFVQILPNLQLWIQLKYQRPPFRSFILICQSFLLVFIWMWQAQSVLKTEHFLQRRSLLLGDFHQKRTWLKWEKFLDQSIKLILSCFCLFHNFWIFVFHFFHFESIHSRNFLDLFCRLTISLVVFWWMVSHLLLWVTIMTGLELKFLMWCEVKWTQASILHFLIVLHCLPN